MNRLKYYYGLLALCCLLVSCSGEENKDNKTETETEYRMVFTDSNYLNGFKVSSTTEGNGAVQGYLTYDGKAKDTPVWLIAQWNCINNDILNSEYTSDGTIHEYKTSGGNKVVVDTHSGSIVLGINTTSEYGLNGITSNPRKFYEPWPTLLLEYALPEEGLVSVFDKKEIRMSVKYGILEVDDRMPDGEVNTGLHSAQFQWFITVQNRNRLSPDYGKYLWFGLNLYDKRYDFAPFYAAEDGGKEQNTGAFIYMPDMKEVMGNQGKTTVGKTMTVDVDILPAVKSAFALAQKRKYLLNTKWEELYIGGSNIGWEVPGTYNATVRIDALNIKYR